jgi:DmsE family decaheme c-type cytochrome
MRWNLAAAARPLVLVAGLLGWCANGMADEREGLPASTTYSSGGVSACTKCHDDDHSSEVLAGPHGMAADPRTPSATKGCESCHGPGGEHAKQEKKFRVAETFAGHDPDLANARSEVCMGCHQKAGQRHFRISEHSNADVACSDCHTVHAREDRIRERLTQAEVCADCHKDQKANMNKYSRHPIREGKVVCTDCHNAHGSKGDHQLVEATTNEVCYKCHAEKRGPFLFEHEPVQDDCSECHNPHGSVNDNLLVARPPFLCQQCHNDTRHPGTVYANAAIVSSNRANGRACTNCHTNVHGSNHPSGITFRR